MFITSFEEQNITYRSCSNLRIHLFQHERAMHEHLQHLDQDYQPSFEDENYSQNDFNR
ncbi:hypothetical protein Q5709_05420 [Acinetobacter radioresistens]